MEIKRQGQPFNLDVKTGAIPSQNPNLNPQ